MTRYLFAALFSALTVAPAAAADHPPALGVTIEQCVDVLDAMNKNPLKGIPPRLLAEAQGVAVIPHVVKAGLAVRGHGVVLTKTKDGTWGEPVFIELGGAGKFHAGVEDADVVLVFHTRAALDKLLAVKGKLTFGKDIPVVAGPVGALPAGKPEAEVASYSHARGLLAGVSVDGTTAHPSADANARFAQPGHDTEQKLAEVLRAKLFVMCAEKPAAPPSKP